jgi:hypothetical protein
MKNVRCARLEEEPEGHDDAPEFYTKAFQLLRLETLALGS